MAVDIRMTHHFDVGVEDFESVMDDPAVIDRQMERMRHVKERRVTRDAHEGRYRYRTVEFVMKQKIPGGGHMVLTEESVYDKEAHQFSYSVTPSTFGKMLETKGTYTLVEETPGRTRRDIEVTVKVKIPGAEKFLEGMMTKSLQRNMEAETEVLYEAIAERFGGGPPSTQGEGSNA